MIYPNPSVKPARPVKKLYCELSSYKFTCLQQIYDNQTSFSYRVMILKILSIVPLRGKSIGFLKAA